MHQEKAGELSNKEDTQLRDASRLPSTITSPSGDMICASIGIPSGDKQAQLVNLDLIRGKFQEEAKSTMSPPENRTTSRASGVVWIFSAGGPEETPDRW